MSLIAISPDASQWRCSLLHVDGIFILLDAGLPVAMENVDIEDLYQPLIPYIPEISFVLISHPSIQHCGGLPWLFAKHELHAPVLCTDPVRQLGELACIAFFEEQSLLKNVDWMELEDVVAAFLSQNFQGLKFGERFLYRKPVLGLAGADGEINNQRQDGINAEDDDDDYDKENNKNRMSTGSQNRPLSAKKRSSTGNNGANYGKNNPQSTAQQGQLECTVQAHPCGSTIGGTYFFLHFGLQKVVYCLDYDLRSTRIVDGLDLQTLLTIGVSGSATISRNHIFITAVPPTRKDIPRLGNERSITATAPTNAAQGKKGGHGSVKSICRTCGEEYFLEKTIEVLRNGGDILIPTDGTCTSALEVIHLLDEAWNVDNALAEKFEICWVSPVADVVLEQARTRMEWVCKKLQEQYHHAKRTPFRFSHVKLFASLEDWAARESKKGSKAIGMGTNKVIVANGHSLENGEAREFFLQICRNPKNMVWLLGYSNVPDDSLANELMTDFIVNKVQQRQYNTRQYIKTRWSEQELRKYYERKCEEEVRRQQDLTAKRKRRQDLHTALQRENDGAAHVTSGAAAGAGDAPQEHVAFDDEDASFFQDLNLFPKHKNFTFEFVQARGDDYGQPLSNKEIEAWKTTHEYESVVTGDGATGASGSAAANQNNPDFDWLWDLRVRFREPMKIDVLDLELLVECMVCYAPLGLKDHRDMRALISSASPLQLILLPTKNYVAEEATNTLKLQYEAMSQTSTTVKTFAPNMDANLDDSNIVHFGSGFSRRKRRAELHEDFINSLAWSKCQSARIAFVQAQVTASPGDEKDDEVDMWTFGPSGKNALVAGGAGGGVVLTGLNNKASNASKPPKLQLIPKEIGAQGAEMNIRDPTETTGEKDNIHPTSSQLGSYPTLLVCPPKLSQFKQTLADEARADNKTFVTEFKSQFGKRVLHIDDKAKLSYLSSSDTIQLEGTCCEQFYKARATLYKKAVCI
ncbi:unnamed protein product [Amoebophrya sp. A120]|nr:unnamed protein product [Amoebophrya sp. A120]|eukprot:GSA120T00003716001.1